MLNLIIHLLHCRNLSPARPPAHYGWRICEPVQNIFTVSRPIYKSASASLSVQHVFRSIESISFMLGMLNKWNSTWLHSSFFIQSVSIIMFVLSTICFFFYYYFLSFICSARKSQTRSIFMSFSSVNSNHLCTDEVNICFFCFLSFIRNAGKPQTRGIFMSFSSVNSNHLCTDEVNIWNDFLFCLSKHCFCQIQVIWKCVWLQKNAINHVKH